MLRARTDFGVSTLLEMSVCFVADCYWEKGKYRYDISGWGEEIFRRQVSRSFCIVSV